MITIGANLIRRGFILSAIDYHDSVKGLLFVGFRYGVLATLSKLNALQQLLDAHAGIDSYHLAINSTSQRHGLGDAFGNETDLLLADVGGRKVGCLFHTGSGNGGLEDAQACDANRISVVERLTNGILQLLQYGINIRLLD